MFLLERGAFLVLLKTHRRWVRRDREVSAVEVLPAGDPVHGHLHDRARGAAAPDRPWQLAVGLLLVAGHNLLDGVVLTGESPFFVPWAILHQCDIIELGAGVTPLTSYPVLPWIGVIVLGHATGLWFARIRAEA